MEGFSVVVVPSGSASAHTELRRDLIFLCIILLYDYYVTAARYFIMLQHERCGPCEIVIDFFLSQYIIIIIINR